MHVNLFFDGLSIGGLLTFKTGPPCIWYYNSVLKYLHFTTSALQYSILWVWNSHLVEKHTHHSPQGKKSAIN